MRNAECRRLNVEEVRGSKRHSAHSSFVIHHSSFFRAYTLVELILTLAVLMIVLGLMRNLSDRVRRVSTDKVARQMLWRLKDMMNQYQLENHGQLPPITPLITPLTTPVIGPVMGAGQPPNEQELQTIAKQNNADFYRYLHLDRLLDRKEGGGDFSDDPLMSGLHRNGPESSVVVDPWGTPIVFMASQNPAIGMAPGDTFFFCSAGPDRAYLTHEDNLYSYDGN